MDDAARILAKRRDELGMSQRGAAVKIGIALNGDEPPPRWVQHIESGPPCPLSNHRRLIAYLEVLRLDPVVYLMALGFPEPGRIWTL